MKLSMNQRILLNLAASEEGLNRWDIDGNGMRTLGSLRNRGLIEPSKTIHGNYELTDAGREAQKAWEK